MKLLDWLLRRVAELPVHGPRSRVESARDGLWDPPRARSGFEDVKREGGAFKGARRRG